MKTVRTNTDRTLRDHAAEIADELRRLAEQSEQNELSRRRLEDRLQEVLNQMADSTVPAARPVNPRLLSTTAVERIYAWMEGEGTRPPASARWLAERCGVSATHIHHVLKRERECSSRLAEAIATVTGIPAPELVPLAGVA